MRSFLTGYKTYIVAVVAILTAVIAWLDGNITDGQALNAIVVAVIGSTLRAGSKSDAEAVVKNQIPK